MNGEIINCRRVQFGTNSSNGEIERVGDFCFDDLWAHIYVWLPGMVGPDAIRIQRGAEGGPHVWGWNGSEDRPTLSPSINVVGRWHGYMKDGQFVT